jgi:hypothetical protein
MGEEWTFRPEAVQNIAVGALGEEAWLGSILYSALVRAEERRADLQLETKQVIVLPCMTYLSTPSHTILLSSSTC